MLRRVVVAMWPDFLADIDKFLETKERLRQILPDKSIAWNVVGSDTVFGGQFGQVFKCQREFGGGWFATESDLEHVSDALFRRGPVRDQGYGPFLVLLNHKRIVEHRQRLRRHIRDVACAARRGGLGRIERLEKTAMCVASDP